MLLAVQVHSLLSLSTPPDCECFCRRKQGMASARFDVCILRRLCCCISGAQGSLPAARTLAAHQIPVASGTVSPLSRLIQKGPPSHTPRHMAPQVRCLCLYTHAALPNYGSPIPLTLPMHQTACVRNVVRPVSLSCHTRFTCTVFSSSYLMSILCFRRSISEQWPKS